MSQNFQILNASKSTATINIDGAIGESWFTEGITKDQIRNDLSQIEASTIIVNISSLGGAMDHAFAIHDMLKMHNATIKVKIIGATASSGTIIAMAGDEIEISENSLFLVHNGWTMTVGNANDHRDMAEELDKWDGVAIGIYSRKTGKSKSKILSLMEEEKWINAEEAKEWGFVDKVFEPVAIAASVYNQIKGSEALPKLPNNKIKIMPEINAEQIEKNVFDKVKAFFKNENKEVSEEAIKAQASEVAKEIKAEYDEKMNTSENEISKIKSSKEEVENSLANEKEAHEAKISEMQAEIDKLKGTKTEDPPSEDPPSGAEDEIPNPVDVMGGMIRNQIKEAQK